MLSQRCGDRHLISMETKKELDDKLVLYKVQLNQVNDLLQVDAQNPQFLKLRDDLDSVIQLTSNLIQQVYSNQNDKSSVDDVEDYSVETEKFSIKKQSSYTAKTGAIVAGENVEVTGGDRLYAGTVVEVINDSEYKIKYFEFDSIVSLPVTSLLRMDVNNPPANQLEEYEVSVDMQCQCKYALDTQYYDCVITGVTKHGYNITFTQYGNSEEVPIEYLRNKPEEVSAFSSSGAARKESGPKKTSDGLIAIPENLKILPTDTEEVRHIVLELES